MTISDRTKMRRLFPLYRDNVSSPEDNETIEVHLAQCEECQGELRRIGGRYPRNIPKESGFVRLIRTNRRARIAFIVIASILVIAIGAFIIWFVSTNRIRAGIEGVPNKAFNRKAKGVPRGTPLFL